MSTSLESLPTLGTVVAFTIDPLASLHPDAQEDPIAIEACQNMVNKTYVGYVVEGLQFFLPWDPYHSYEIQFVLRGEPKGSPADGVEPSMFIPLSPSTGLHSSPREPLKLSNPLPWPDCYLSPFVKADIRSPTASTADPIDCRLSLSEIMRHEAMRGDDFMKAKALRDAAAHWQLQGSQSSGNLHPTTTVSLNPGETQNSPKYPDSDSGKWLSDAPSVTSRSPPDSFHGNDLADPAHRSARDGPGMQTLPDRGLDSTLSLPSIVGSDGETEQSVSLGTEDDAEGDDRASLDNIFAHAFSQNRANEPMITVNFTHVLSSVKELNDPRDFFREAEEIAQIEAESLPRMKEAKARAIEEARRMDTEAYDERTFKLLFSSPGDRIFRVASRIRRKGKKILQHVVRLVRPTRIRS
ncbi:hypothetical protein C8J57DRAFT_1313323 [Mycena rebaudengoi]|nr:hypothetical protein C8J57DRAFT_1313323 [Mycena rebaudengoi]